MPEHDSDRRRSSLVVLGAALLLLPASGCEIPTELPRWSTDWDLVLVADTLRAEQLLPAAVRPTADGFVVDSISRVSSVRLGDVCELCTCFSGSLPEVEIGATDWAVPLPPGVVEAEVTEGTARVVIHNELSFDLLDDGEGGRGHLTVELTDARSDEVLRTGTLRDPLPPGDSAALELSLPGVELHQNLVARVRGRTPGTGCDSVSLSPDAGLRTGVHVRDLRVRTVRVALADEALRFRARRVELPAALARRLRPGDARIVMDATISNAARTDAEVTISAAGRESALFGGDAALHTPVPVPGGAPDDPNRVEKRFLLDLDGLPDAGIFHLDSRTRITGSRVVTLRGLEEFVHRIRLRVHLPSR